MSELRYNIIFRACDAVNAINKNPRPFNLQKSTLIKICFLSLYESAQAVPHTFRVLGDKLSDEMIDFFSGFNVELTNGDYGNDESIRQTLEIAQTISENEWIYFCEDDYLHQHNAMLVIDNFLKQKTLAMQRMPRLYNLTSFLNLNNKDIVIHPPDYPDRYKGKYRRFSLVLHSEICHWRQITDTTFTFLMQSSTVKKHHKLLMRASNKANDRLLSRKLYSRCLFFGKALCLSPIPGLATHMHVDTMTPIVDWENIVQRYLNVLSA